MLSKLSVKKPFTVIVAVIIIIILGVVSYLKLDIDLLPEMELPYVVVMTTYPGASPEQVDQDVSRPLEGALATISGLETISSVSNENYSMVILQFSASMNMDSAMIELSSAVDSVSASFADGVAAPILMRINPSMLPVMIMTADKDGMSETEFTAYAQETLQPALERVEGVASVSLMGAISEQVEIRWDQPAIDALNQQILDSIDAELSKAQQELDDARAEIRRGKAELERESAKAYKELADASSQLSDGRLQLQLGLNTIEQTPAQLEAQKQELLSTKGTLEMVDGLLDELAALEDELYLIDDAVADIEAQEAELRRLENSLLRQEEALQAALAAYLAAPDGESAAALQEEMMDSGSLLAELWDVLQLLEADLSGSLGDVELSQLLDALSRDALALLFENQPEQAAALAERLLVALSQSEQGLEQARDFLKEQRRELEKADEQMQEYLEEMKGSMPDMGGMDLSDMDGMIDQIDEGIYQIDKALAEMPGAKYELEQAREELEEGSLELEKGKLELSTQLSSAAVQLAMGEAQLDTAYEQFEEAREEAFKNAGLDGVLTTDMLSGILTASNFSMPAGYLEGEEEKPLVKVGDKFASLDEVENLLLMDLGMEEIGPVYLRDVAKIELTDTAGEYYARVNGNPGLILSLSKQSMYSTNTVSASINEAMAQLMENDPELHLVALSDQGYYIRMAVSAVLNNLLIGAALAVAVLILFLRSVRPTLVITLSIPISLMGALALMYFSGVSINVISLAGLATGVGMLVDNSIVVIENIFRLRALGIPPATAAVRGAKQVAGAIASSTLTTICVFLPIVFTEGLSRQLFTDMGLTVAYSLLASLLVALSLVPMLASRILSKPMKPQGKGFSGFLRGYGRLLGWTLRNKWLIFLLVIGLAVYAVAQVASMGTGLMPAVDYGQVSVELRAPEGQELSEEEIQAAADKLTEEILQLEGISMVGAFEGSLLSSMGMGGSEEEYMLSLYVLCDPESGLRGKEAIVRLEEIAADLPVECSIASASMDMTAMTGGSGVQVYLYGEDGAVLAELAAEVSQRLKTVEGISQVEDGLGQTAPELRVKVDKNAAMKHGLTVAQVFMELSSALRQETEAMSLSLAEKDYPVVIVSAPEDALNREKLEDYLFTIEKTNMQGEKEEVLLRLHEIAEVQEGESLASISRTDQKRYHSVSGELKEGYNIGLVSAEAEKALADLELPAGYQLEMAGENTSIQETMGDLLLMIGLAVVFIYLIMVAQFQSLLLPFIVLTTIPLAFTGGLLTLILLGVEVSIVAMLGFLILAGIIVNNGIVFIDCVNQLRLDEGMEKREALIAAGQMRMRPIFMTALTTIFGLGSMAFSQQMGSELLQPLALVAVGGMIYATILTMFFVPACYDLLQRRPLRQVEILEDEEELLRLTAKAEAEGKAAEAEAETETEAEAEAEAPAAPETKAEKKARKKAEKAEKKAAKKTKKRE